MDALRLYYKAAQRSVRDNIADFSFKIKSDIPAGLYHIGVVKALFEQDLLPRIISGTAVGALIAALICIHTDDELPVGEHGNN